MSSADICLIMEACSPSMTEKRSTWVHDLLESHADKKFHIVSVVSSSSPPSSSSPFPSQHLAFRPSLLKNLVGVTSLTLGQIPLSASPLSKKERTAFYTTLTEGLIEILIKGNKKGVQTLLDLFDEHPQKLSQENLLKSPEAWEMLLYFYKFGGHSTCFLDFFEAWHPLLRNLYTVLMAPLPQAKIYQAMSPGYAGLLMTKGHFRYGVPCLLTEHTFYAPDQPTKILLESRHVPSQNMDFRRETTSVEGHLEDFWKHPLRKYAQISAAVCSERISPDEGNRKGQISRGTASQKLPVLPDGIDLDTYKDIQRAPFPSHPTIALIGPIIPVKDVQTFILACVQVREKIPSLKAYIIGPTDEDRSYYEGCLETVTSAGLEETIEFTGKVKLKDYLPLIDLNVLTSLSESSLPSTLLETGASGIPTLATDVGGCREIIMGHPGETTLENPPLPCGGAIIDVASPDLLAQAIIRLLSDPVALAQSRYGIRTRMQTYYPKSHEEAPYKSLYETYLPLPSPLDQAA